MAIERTGLSQTEFARMHDISRPLLSRWINNPRRPPGADTVAALARIFGVSKAWLHYGVGTPEDDEPRGENQNPAVLKLRERLAALEKQRDALLLRQRSLLETFLEAAQGYDDYFISEVTDLTPHRVRQIRSDPDYENFHLSDDELTALVKFSSHIAERGYPRITSLEDDPPPLPTTREEAEHYPMSFHVTAQDLRMILNPDGPEEFDVNLYLPAAVLRALGFKAEGGDEDFVSFRAKLTRQQLREIALRGWTEPELKETMERLERREASPEGAPSLTSLWSMRADERRPGSVEIHTAEKEAAREEARARWRRDVQRIFEEELPEDVARSLTVDSWNIGGRLLLNSAVQFNPERVREGIDRLGWRLYRDTGTRCSRILIIGPSSVILDVAFDPPRHRPDPSAEGTGYRGRWKHAP